MFPLPNGTDAKQAARFGSEGCVLRLLTHGAGRWKRDKAKKTASDLAIAAGHLHIAGIISADPKKCNIMEIASQVLASSTGWMRPDRDTFSRFVFLSPVFGSTALSVFAKYCCGPSGV